MQIPSKLKNSLVARECVAFVGAGFSVPCGMPSWGLLLEQLLFAARGAVGAGDVRKQELLDACESEVKAGRYMTASIGIRELLSHEELARLLTDAFSHDRLRRLPEAAKTRMLARMENLVLGPWCGMMTTNYDTLIESGIEKFCKTAAPLRADCGPSLGHVLCVSPGTPNFFVKLHGEAWAHEPVLCSDDYIRVWQASPRMRHFMTAVMLRYRLVFIGCSVEDEILRLRQELWAMFNKTLPRCYALMPDTPQNRIRSHSLNVDAGIETLLYEMTAEADGHGAVDEFLRQVRQCAETLHSDSLDGTVGALSSMGIPQRLQQIGEINRALLRVCRAQPNGRLQDQFLYTPLWESLKLEGEASTLRGCTEGERVYRALFLASINLLRQVTADKQLFFEVSSVVANELQSMSAS
jgi:hypothetical protein